MEVPLTEVSTHLYPGFVLLFTKKKNSILKLKMSAKNDIKSDSQTKEGQGQY
jgi:hypothetical protein